MNYLKQFKTIDTFIFDVDGVLTNGELLILESGQLLRKMSVRDGYALKKAIKEGYRICIISGGKSEGVVERLKALGISDIFIGVDNKLEVYHSYIKDHKLDAAGILYMGDDLPDYEPMRMVALPACPSDATHEIRALSQYISSFKGGEGCVRDVIEKVLRLHGRWNDQSALLPDRVNKEE